MSFCPESKAIVFLKPFLAQIDELPHSDQSGSEAFIED
jgi:hypothetical protein